MSVVFASTAHEGYAPGQRARRVVAELAKWNAQAVNHYTADSKKPDNDPDGIRHVSNICAGLIALV